MKCKLCLNENNNKPLILREMMFGLREEFDYFQCGNCGCIQIARIPENMGKYYPADYYSYTLAEVPVKRSLVRRIHFDYHCFGKYKLPGSLLALKFKPSLFYEWLKILNLYDRNESVLDVGCGNGRLLKRMYRLGFNDLTGIDPFMEKDTMYNKNLRLLRKSIFDMEGSFDVIMMHHSLEHMDQQNAVIKKAASLLSNRGRLLIRIPTVSKPLMEKYGANVVSLDPPRHFYIHSRQSIQQLVSANGLSIYKTVFDAEMFSILGSEQYTRGISNVNDERSYMVNVANSVFSQEDLNRFQAEIDRLNQQEQSDSIALYIR